MWAEELTKQNGPDCSTVEILGLDLLLQSVREALLRGHYAGWNHSSSSDDAALLSQYLQILRRADEKTVGQDLPPDRIALRVESKTPFGVVQKSLLLKLLICESTLIACALSTRFGSASVKETSSLLSSLSIDQWITKDDDTEKVLRSAAQDVPELAERKAALALLSGRALETVAGGKSWEGTLGLSLSLGLELPRYQGCRAFDQAARRCFESLRKTRAGWKRGRETVPRAPSTLGAGATPFLFVRLLLKHSAAFEELQRRSGDRHEEAWFWACVRAASLKIATVARAALELESLGGSVAETEMPPLLSSMWYVRAYRVERPQTLEEKAAIDWWTRDDAQLFDLDEVRQHEVEFERLQNQDELELQKSISTFGDWKDDVKELADMAKWSRRKGWAALTATKMADTLCVCTVDDQLRLTVDAWRELGRLERQFGVTRPLLKDSGSGSLALLQSTDVETVYERSR